MHFHNKLLKNILGWGIKSSLFFFLLFVVFSPLGLEKVQAACQLPGGEGISIKPSADGTCPANTTPTAGEKVAPPVDNGGIGPELAQMLSNIIYVFTVGIGTIIALVASYFFNLAVYISLQSTAYALTFLGQQWTEVRDIANMGFIFILIYIAVTITLTAETSNTMKMLVKVIAIALVINFSFFFTRVVIDGGNILAITFYNSISATTVAQTTATGDNTTYVAGKIATGATNVTTNLATLTGQTGASGAKDLTASIMGAIDVQNILGTQSFKAFNASLSGAGAFVTELIVLSFIYICVGIILGLLAAMFFTVGIKFITRIVVLWIVIIAAPLALLMYAVPNPKAQGYFKEWLNALITYSLYPAIFLFLFIIIINFTYGLAGCTGGTCASSILAGVFNSAALSSATGPTYVAGLIANISIKLGFIMMMLYLAIQASNAVSKWGGTLAQNITARPDKLGASLAGFSRRAPLWGARIATSPVTAPAGFAARIPGRAAARLDGVLKSSSLANSKAWWNTASLAARGIQKNALQPLANTSILGAKSFKANKDEWDKEMKERGINRDDITNRNNVTLLAAIKPQLDAIQAKEALAKANNTAANLTQDELDKKAQGAQLRSDIKKLNKRELESFKVTDIKKIVGEISESQMKTLKDSDKIGDNDKKELETKWQQESSSGPLKKTEQQIDLLKGIRKELSHLNLAKVSQHTAPNVTLNMNSVKEMRAEIEEQMADARHESRNGPDATAKKAAERDAIRLQKGLNELKTLEDRLKEVPRGLQEKAPGIKTESSEVVIK
jgi:hypothetical protein